MYRLAEASCTGLGQPQRLAPAITAPPLDGDQTVTLQRQDIPSEGGAVHDHIRGKGVERHRSQWVSWPERSMRWRCE
jgi:hypothetical protein